MNMDKLRNINECSSQPVLFPILQFAMRSRNWNSK